MFFVAVGIYWYCLRHRLVPQVLPQTVNLEMGHLGGAQAGQAQQAGQPQQPGQAQQGGIPQNQK